MGASSKHSYLDFNREKESRGKGMNRSNAWNRAWIAIGVTGFQVPMSEGQQPPDHREEHPRAKEG